MCFALNSPFDLCVLYKLMLWLYSLLMSINKQILLSKTCTKWLPFADDIFKYIFLNENYDILIQVSIKFVPIDNRSSLLQARFWQGLVDKPSEPIMAMLLMHILLKADFLPETSFGLRVLSLPASVCVCLSVCQALACPRDNSGPVQARIAKFGPKMQKTLVKVPIVLGSNWLWPSRSNLTSKSEFTPFWACPDHNSLPIQARITKFGPGVENSLVKVPIVLGGNWLSRSNLI